MNYKSRDPAGLSNTELLLLELADERDQLSGYEIDRLVEERGFREWAGLGRTSIYGGLGRLEKRGLLRSRLDEAKAGRGPLPRRFDLTEAGRQALAGAIVAALASAEEGSGRFDLALAGLSVLAPGQAPAALEERLARLEARAGRVGDRFKAQGGEALPLHVQALFEHRLFLIRYEIAFTTRLKQALAGPGPAETAEEKGH